MDLQQLMERVAYNVTAHGFRDNGPRSVAEHVALLVTEIGELYEAHRDGVDPHEHLYDLPCNKSSRDMYDDEGNLGKPSGIPSELADLVIRCCDMASELGIDLVRAIEEKMAYNATRPHKHGRQG